MKFEGWWLRTCLVTCNFKLRTFLAVTVLALLPANAAAQAVATVERKLLPFRLGPLETVPKSFWDGLTFLRDEEDRQRSLKAEISFGLSGDEAGERSLFRLNTGIGLSRGVFPSEVSVVSRLFLQLRDGQLQEDITSLQITYDYHASHHVEYFAFAERVSDSFLSIQHRYEVGFGARAGLQFGRSGDGRATDSHFAAVAAGLPAVDASLPAVRSAIRGGTAAQAGLQEVTPPEWANFRSSMDDMKRALAYRQTRLFLGVAVSVFSEIESAVLDVATVPAGGSGNASDVPVRSRVAIAPQQRYRTSIRPSFRFRPSSQVQIAVFPYFKLPLDGARRVTVADGSRRLDYRRDILSEMSATIRKEQTGLENVELVFTFNHYYDNVPPALPQSLVSSTLAAGRVFDRTAAEGTHRVIALALRLRW